MAKTVLMHTHLMVAGSPNECRLDSPTALPTRYLRFAKKSRSESRSQLGVLGLQRLNSQAYDWPPRCEACPQLIFSESYAPNHPRRLTAFAYL